MRLATSVSVTSPRRMFLMPVLSVLVTACAPAGARTPQTQPTATVAAEATTPGSPTTAPRPTPSPDPTTAVSVVDGLTVTSISLGAEAAPIDVVSSFGSIWVALHHQDAVSRIDPVSLEETARIGVGAGPGWFAVTDDALWVSSQMSSGLTRIDPDTNTAAVTAGDASPCGAPVYAAGSVWQFACDAQSIMRIDPQTYRVVNIPASGYLGVGQVAEDVVAIGSAGVARIDLESNRLERLAPGSDGFPVLFDDRSVWLGAPGVINRVAVVDGRILASLPVAGEAIMTPGDHRVWVTENGVAVHEVDPSASTITRTLHLQGPTVAREADGVVWVTSFEGNTLAKFEP